jgi:hypothetical protein
VEKVLTKIKVPKRATIPIAIETKNLFLDLINLNINSPTNMGKSKEFEDLVDANHNIAKPRIDKETLSSSSVFRYTLSALAKRNTVEEMARDSLSIDESCSKIMALDAKIK